MNSRIHAIAQVLAILLAGALASVLAKLALRDVPAFTFVWLQVAIGGALLTLYTFGWRGERLPRGIDRRIWAHIIGIGLCNFTIVRPAMFLAIERLPITTAVYLISFVGIATMAFSSVLSKERPSALAVFGALLALAGLRLFFPELPAPTERVGLLYAALTVLTLATYNTIARNLGTSAGEVPSNNLVSTLAVWIGGLPLVLFGLATDWPPPVSGWQNWGIVTLNGVVAIAIGLTVFNRVLRTLRSYEASILASSGVVWTALLALPVLGERLSPSQVVGIATMLSGLALVQIRGRTTG